MTTLLQRQRRHTSELSEADDGPSLTTRQALDHSSAEREDRHGVVVVISPPGRASLMARAFKPLKRRCRERGLSLCTQDLPDGKGLSNDEHVVTPPFAFLTAFDVRCLTGVSLL